MFTVEAIAVNENGQERMIVHDFDEFNDAIEYSTRLRQYKGVNVTRVGEYVTPQPDADNVTMNGRYSCD